LAELTKAVEVPFFRQYRAVLGEIGSKLYVRNGDTGFRVQ
jgi:hypothetical protein